MFNDIKKKKNPKRVFETYKNWQRPGAAIKLTLSEACEATEKDGKLIVMAAKYKTGLTYGPAAPG